VFDGGSIILYGLSGAWGIHTIGRSRFTHTKTPRAPVLVLVLDLINQIDHMYVAICFQPDPAYVVETG
jgi:hypothetical protein